MASKANSFNVTKRCFVWHIFLFLPEDDFVVYDQKMYKKIALKEEYFQKLDTFN